jgi:hypothetical protein
MSLIREGAYEIRREGRTVGTEEFVIEPRGEEGLRLRSLARYHWPARHRLAIRQELDRSGRFLSLSAVLETEGDEPVTGDFRVEGETLRARVRRGEDEPRETQFSWQAGDEIDFASPLFNQVAVSHLGLEEGAARELRVHWITLPGLDIQPARERYERRGDEDLILPVGRQRARSYRLRVEGEEDVHESLLWIDPRGLVLRMCWSFEGEEGEVILTRLESRE